MGGTPDAASEAAGRFSFRPLQLADLPLLHGWLARPHWTQWWGPAPTFAEVQADYGAWISDPAQVQPHIALLDGAPFGYIQSYVAMGSGGGWWEDETDPGVRGIDQSIADAAQLGKGLGTAMVKAWVAKLFADRKSPASRPTRTRAMRARYAVMKKPGFAQWVKC